MRKFLKTAAAVFSVVCVLAVCAGCDMGNGNGTMNDEISSTMNGIENGASDALSDFNNGIGNTGSSNNASDGGTGDTSR